MTTITDRQRRRTSRAPETCASAYPPTVNTGAASVGGYALILGVGLCALLYLALSWRAVELDTQVSRLEEELGRARFEHLQARRELFAALSPEALNEDAPGLTPTGAGALPEPEVIPMPSLPPPEPCILGEVGGQGDPGAGAQHAARAGEGGRALAAR